MFVFGMTFAMGVVGVIGSYTSSLVLDHFGRRAQLFWTLLTYSMVMVVVALMD